jgi:hypothetical protein
MAIEFLEKLEYSKAFNQQVSSDLFNGGGTLRVMRSLPLMEKTSPNSRAALLRSASAVPQSGTHKQRAETSRWT